MFSRPFSDLFNLTSTQDITEIASQNDNHHQITGKEKAKKKLDQDGQIKAEQSTLISDQEKQHRKDLVEKAKLDLQRLSAIPGQIDKTDKLIKETGILKLFDEFIQGTIPQASLAKHLQ